ncbi:putative RNA recognition motif domain, nucleotide-binding alpha-beta plait domain superfamily [Helianthus annuus]|nr:putative RNA recognition motif domain, nucleotide-binding alpha-beta plait domain superfamily [Helianthus annuus]
MRPIFCGNIEFDARQGDLERLFRKYGKVDRVDLKSGFAFIYMEDERDAGDAIRALDRYEFGRKGRRLRVEWTKQERNVREPVSAKRSSSNSRPSKTLFVINFDPYNTRTRDLERHFDPYGKILNIRIRRNFAFIQYELQEDATKALESTNMSKLMDRVISVEYAIKDDDDRKNGSSPGGRDRSPRRRSDDRGRSQSPYRRERGSPDYGRGRDRGSPDYGRGRGRSPSPHRRDRGSPVYDRGSSLGANGKGRARNADYRRDASPSPRRERERTRSPRGSNPKERTSPEYEHGAIVSPQSEGRVSPNDYPREPSPDPKPDTRDSPGYNSGAESPPERYRSRSPEARERSRS